MIIPMIKYKFLVYHKEYKDFLEKIQDFGVLDIEYINDNPEQGENLQTLEQVKNSLSFLKLFENHKAKADKNKMPASEFMVQLKGEQEDYNNLLQTVTNLDKDIKALHPWGEFDMAKLLQLDSVGYDCVFISCSPKVLEKIKESDLIFEEIRVKQGLHYLIVFKPKDEADIDFDCEIHHLPKKGLKELELEKIRVNKKIDALKAKFEVYNLTYESVLQEYAEEVNAEIDFNKALTDSNFEADDKLRILSGWLPAPDEAKFISFLEENKIVYMKRRAHPDDKGIPIKLKNNRFAKLFEPIGNMFAMPDYKELDMTPFFAPFFMMFFGFCLGDAGYGIVYLLGASLLKLKIKAQSKRRLLSLVQFLGASTIFFGLLTGTFFGISLLKVEGLGSIKNYMLESGTVFNLALFVGLFQIYVGTAIRAANQIKQFGFAYGLSAIGWLLLIPFGLDAIKTHYTGTVGVVLFFVGLALILFFSDPKAGLFGRIGKGIWDLYNITGIFGDVLSYIRLFALGVSSSILGFVVNDIGLQIKSSIPILGPVLFVIFITVGHMGNMMLSSLGSFVHPMRLTFVEFYKNAGFAGGGKKYTPFKKK